MLIFHATHYVQFWSQGLTWYWLAMPWWMWLVVLSPSLFCFCWVLVKGWKLAFS